MIVTKPFYRISLLEGTTLWNFKITEYFTAIGTNNWNGISDSAWDSSVPVAKQKDVYFDTDVSSLAHVIVNVSILCRTTAASQAMLGGESLF